MKNFPIFGASPSISLVQKQILEGRAFRFFHDLVIPAGTVESPGEKLIYVEHGNKTIYLFSRLVKISGPGATYEVYGGSDAVSTTPLNIFNMRGDSQNTSGLTFSEPTVVNNLGTLGDKHPLGGAESAGNRLVGDESIDADTIKVQPKSSSSILRFTNTSVEDLNCFIYLKWFEQNYGLER